LSNGDNSKDLIFTNRKTILEIKNENDDDIIKEQIFVVEPYNDEDFNFKKMSTLLVNKELKKQYDEIHIKIDEEKDRLLEKLKTSSGLPNNIEE
jgi:hypothetical protein